MLEFQPDQQHLTQDSAFGDANRSNEASVYGEHIDKIEPASVQKNKGVTIQGQKSEGNFFYSIYKRLVTETNIINQYNHMIIAVPY